MSRPHARPHAPDGPETTPVASGFGPETTLVASSFCPETTLVASGFSRTAASRLIISNASSSCAVTKAWTLAATIGHAACDASAQRSPAMTVSSGPAIAQGRPARAAASTHAAFAGSQEITRGVGPASAVRSCEPLRRGKPGARGLEIDAHDAAAASRPPTPACTNRTSGGAVHCAAASSKIRV